MILLVWDEGAGGTVGEQCYNNTTALCGGLREWEDRGVRWRIRPYVRAADRQWVEDLWVAAMPPSWPLLPAGIAILADGLVAEAGTGPVGLAAIDRAGSSR